jgi:hypothetical protein
MPGLPVARRAAVAACIWAVGLLAACTSPGHAVVAPAVTATAAAPPVASSLVSPMALYHDVPTGSTVQGIVEALATPAAPLRCAITKPPAHGSATLSGAAGNAYSYTPRAGHIGYDHFEVTASLAETGNAASALRQTTRVVVMQNQAPTRRTWVVDAGNGQDSNPGTEAAPLATLKAAHLLTGPGDTVLVKNGRYEQTGIESVVHKTVAHNSLTPTLNYGELYVHNASRVRVLNNIAVSSTSSHINGTGKGDPRTVNVVYDHNLYFGPVAPFVVGPNDRIADPRFIDYAARHLRPRADSPAIGLAGAPALGVDLGPDLEGRPRHISGQADRGAYGYRRD